MHDLAVIYFTVYRFFFKQLILKLSTPLLSDLWQGIIIGEDFFSLRYPLHAQTLCPLHDVHAQNM
jgi:hypothetical protein